MPNVLTGRNPSALIGRNPSPRANFAYRQEQLARATAIDTNGIIVGAPIDNRDGSFTFTLDDSTAVTDPADGYVLAWPAMGPDGVPLTVPIKYTHCGIKLRGTFPGTTTDVVAIGGVSDSLGLTGNYIGNGIISTGGLRSVHRWSGAAAATGAADVDGQSSLQQLFWLKTTINTLFSGRNNGYTTADASFGGVSIGPVPTDFGNTLYFWMSVYRTATGGGNVTLTVEPFFEGTSFTPKFTQ
jgi:hypothetical protein